MLFCAAWLAALPAGAETAVYLAHGRDAALFGRYDVNGFSMEAFPERSGVKLIVRSVPVKTARLAVYAPDRSTFRLPPAPERDALAARLSRGKTVEGAVEKAILDWVASEVSYDADRSLPQDPVSVFASRKAYCVGFAELAVDLLRRAGIAAETVQGVLMADRSMPGYAPELGGVYHRWVKIYSPARGWRFADPLGRLGAVNARYVPFAHRSWTRPEDLHLQKISEGAE
ncbi:MAG: transglutaminase-like domain-containing protein [Thermoanaerobaculia bacterium]